LGRSRGGFSTKLHAIVDTKGRPFYITLTPGERHEMTKAEELFVHANGKAFIGDTAYDSEPLAKQVRAKGMKFVVCSHPTRKRKRRIDRKLYKKRYRVEVCFHDLKRFRAIATRYDKTACSYLALLHVACLWLWLAA